VNSENTHTQSPCQVTPSSTAEEINAGCSGLDCQRLIDFEEVALPRDHVRKTWLPRGWGVDGQIG
jgi:hypothetical protein